MSTLYHSDIVDGQQVNAASINGPLGTLDAAIAAIVSSSSGLWSVALTNTATAGQKVVPCVPPAGAAVNQAVFIGDSGGTNETGVIASIQAGVSITLVSNLAATYAAGKVICTSPTELVEARGGQATLWALLRKAGAWSMGTAFPGGAATGDVCIRTDRSYACYRYDGAAWKQFTVPSVTAFWGTPSTGDRAFRTDLTNPDVCVYDGTRWMTQGVHYTAFGGSAAINIVPSGQTYNAAAAQAHCAEMTGLPIAGLEAVQVVVQAGGSVANTSNCFQIRDYGGVNVVCAAFPGAVANFLNAAGGVAKTGGTNNRQIDFQVTWGAGVITVYAQVVGYWAHLIVA